MNNCDLLNFRFVDRIEAKKTLHDFINGTSAAPVLWISGEQGIGITRLIKEVISKNETETIDAICSFKDDKDPSQLNELITALKKNKSGLGISDFIRNNYSDVLDITKKISTQILKLAGLDIADFVASFYDSSKLFVDQKKQQHSSLNVLNSYISHIIKDNTLIVVLEHFTCCNKNYADAFIQLIINFMETQNIYFIITSTNEELESNCNFVTDFLSKIPIQKMKIEPLEDLYIYEILEDKFAISKEDRDIVCQLSKLCNGSPSRLRNTFSNMFMKGDISLSKDSDIAQTVFDKLKKDIASNDLSFKYDEFDLFSRTLLKLIIAFKEQASLSLLTKFSSKILEEEFGVKVIEEEILKSAFKLIENGIIGRDDKAYSGHKVKIENSLLRNTIEESIKAEPSYIMFSYWMQKHILENMEDVIASGLSKEMAEYLVAFHSVIGVVPDWVEIAVNYGILQFEKNNIAAAVEFFHHVREQVTSISSDKLIVMANCYFQDGNYDVAEKLLRLIDERKDCQAWEFYYLYFVFNEITEESIKHFDKEQTELLNNYMLSGGDVTLKALRKLQNESPETLCNIIGYLKEAPLYEIVTAGGKNFLLCHSGLDNFSPERSPADYTADELIWAWPELTDRYFDDCITVFGHTPTKSYGEKYNGKILKTDTWIDVDVGVPYGNNPCLLRLDDLKEFYL